MSECYLITWNPNKWDFEGGYKSFLRSVQNGEEPVEPWTVCSSSIKKGDTLYLMKLGGIPRGIIARGVSIDDVHYDKHYDEKRAAKGDRTKHVNVKFEFACDYSEGKYIDWNELKEQFPNQNWTPQASGIRIKKEYYVGLENLWDGICHNSSVSQKDKRIDDINVPLSPRFQTTNSNGAVQYICGRCFKPFLMSPRCPECGQLVEE